MRTPTVRLTRLDNESSVEVRISMALTTVTIAMGALIGPVIQALPASAVAGVTVLPVLSAEQAGFSPNGDGRQDKLTFSYTTSIPGVLALEFSNSEDDPLGLKMISGLDSAQPIGFEVLQPGPGTFVWDGSRDDSHAAIAEGVLNSRLAVVHLGTDSSCTDVTNSDCYIEDHSAAVSVHVVRTGAKITVSAGTRSLYPTKDGYRDSLKLSAKAVNAVSTSFTLKDAKGHTIRAWSGGAKTWTSTWTGKTNSGTTVKPGRYVLAGSAKGLYGIAATNGSISIEVSKGHMVRHTKSRTLVPDSIAVNQLSGGCSAVFGDIGTGSWTGSDYYDSMGRYPNCDLNNHLQPDAAIMQYAFTLPKAPKYGSVRLSAQGESCAWRKGGTAVVVMGSYLGDNAALLMEPGYGTYFSGWVAVSKFDSPRVIDWAGIADNGDCYIIKRFKIKWTYYVLQK